MYRPVDDDNNDDDCRPNGIWRCLSPANWPSAAGGGWENKGLSGSLVDGRRDNDVEQRPREGCVGNQYEERCGHRRMVVGGMIGGDTTISQGEATMTRR